MQEEFQNTNGMITKNYYFSFYNGILTRMPKNTLAANLIVILQIKNKEIKKISLIDRNAKNYKIKICDILEKEISTIKLNIDTFVLPDHIETVSNLKKAIIQKLPFIIND